MSRRTILITLCVTFLCALESRGQEERSPLSLRESIAIAIENNAQVLIAREMIPGSQAKIEESRNGFYPQVNLTAGYTRLWPVSTYSFQMGPFTPPITMKFGLEDSYNAMVTMQYQLFNWGRTQAGLEISQAGLGLSETGHALARFNVAHQVAQLFYGVLVSQEALKVLDQNLASLQSKLESNRRRYETGIVSKFDVVAFEVQLSTVRSRKLDMINSLTKLEIMFNRLLGRSPDSPVSIAGTLETESFAANPDSLTRSALNNRIELSQLRIQEELASRQVALTNTLDKPSLMISANYGLRNGFFPNPDVLRGNWTAGLSLVYPLFDGFRTSAQLDQSEINVKTIRMRGEDLKQSIASEIRQTVAELDMNQQKLSIEQTKVTQAAEALKMAEERYDRGLMSATDLLDSQTGLESAKLSSLQAIYNSILSRFNLDRATGKAPY